MSPGNPSCNSADIYEGLMHSCPGHRKGIDKVVEISSISGDKADRGVDLRRSSKGNGGREDQYDRRFELNHGD